MSLSGTAMTSTSRFLAGPVVPTIPVLVARYRRGTSPGRGEGPTSPRTRRRLAFGQGCFKAIRNVLAHEYGTLAEPPEEEALHYLAAFSVLARWIDQATVER